jgi:hypothetical protein
MLAKAGQSAGWSTQALDDIFSILWTKSGPQMIGMLHALADDGFKGAADEATKLGAVMDDKVTASLAKLGEQQKVTSQIWKTTTADMAGAMAPLLTVLDQGSAKLGLFLQNASQAVDGHLGTIFKGAGAVVGGAPGAALGLIGGSINDTGGSGAPKVDPGQSNGGAVKSADTVAKETEAANKKSADWERSMDDDIEAAVKAQQKLNEEKQKADIASEAADWADIEAAEREQQKKQLAEQEFALETQIKAAMDAGNQAKADGLKLDLERLKNSQMDKGLLDARIAVLKQEYETKRTLSAIEAQETIDEATKGTLEKQRQEIAKNAGLDAAARRAQMLANAQEYRAVMTDLLALEKQRLALTNSPEQVAKLQAKIKELQAQLADYGKATKKTDQTPEQESQKRFNEMGDPSKNFSSAGGAAVAGLQDSISRLPTTFDQIHSAVTAISQDLSGGIASGLAGIINRTESVHQAFMKIGASIEQTMINAITKFIAQLVIAEAEALILAALTGGASTGAGAAGGGAGAIMKLFGFSAGGFTGDAPVGVVHDGEWVAPAWMVDHPVSGTAIAALENMRNGASSLSQLSDVTHASLASRGMGRPSSFGASPSSTQAAGGGRMSVTFVDDRQSALTAMRRSKGKQTVVNIMRNGRGEFFA